MKACENHTAVITDRGGQNVLGYVENLQLVRWGRERDDISSALIWAKNPGIECQQMLAAVHPGRHEMVIYRGDDRVWEGPVTRKTSRMDYVEIEARDVMHYAHRTVCHSGYSSAYPNVETVTERAWRIMEAEMARKEALSPPIDVLAYVDVRTNSDTARTTKVTKRMQMTVWEDIDSMAAKAGLDYTVVGRRIILNDVHDVLGRTEVMTDADFLSGIVVTEYGMELATRTIVTDGMGNYGSAGGTDPYYGEWEILATAYEEEVTTTGAAPTPPSTAELRQQAKRNASGRYPTPVVIRVPDGSRLNPQTTALSVEGAVPGVRIPVRATVSGVDIVQEQKLDSLRVEETAEDGESIMVTLSPAPGGVPEEWDTAGSDD